MHAIAVVGSLFGPNPRQSGINTHKEYDAYSTDVLIDLRFTARNL